MKHIYFFLFFIVLLFPKQIQAQANDNCASAISISCGDTVSGETTMDTDSGFNPSPDEFFIFTGQGFEQEVTVSLCDNDTNYDTWLRIFSSCDLTNQIADNDDTCGTQSEVVFTSDGVSSYIIMVEGYNDRSGDFSLSISCTTQGVPPPNDLIENAIDISQATTSTSGNFTDPAVSTPDATPEMGTTNDCNLAGIDGVWYYFTPSLTLFSEGFIDDPSGIQAMIFFTAPNENATIEDLTRVDENSNPCFTGDQSSILAFEGQTYYVFAANKGAITDINFSFGALGIEEDSTNNFKLYPNPASNELYLNAEKPIETIAVINMLGQTVIMSKSMNSSLTLDVSTLDAGAYFVSVTIEGETKNFQFIKK